MHEVHSRRARRVQWRRCHRHGVCRTPSHATTCAKADGTRCVACETGSIPFDSLSCVGEGECVEHVNGPFQRCKDEMFLAAQTGRCVESDLVGRETEVRGICLRVTRDVLCV